MSNRFRRWILGTAFMGGSVLVGHAVENNAYAQQPSPLQPPMPLPALPGGTPTTPPGANVKPGPATTPPAATTPPGSPPAKPVPGPNEPYPGASTVKASIVPYVVPPANPEERPLPITLAVALKLANAQAWDVGIAAQQIRVASAQLTRANVLWVPTLVAGVDYQHHDGTYQNVDGTFTGVNRNAVMLGGAPEVAFAFTEAIFEPLAARQVMKARKADLQTVTNDTTLAVARAYFDVQQARGVLAGTMDTIERSREVLRRVEQMAPGLVPDVEVYRARAQLRQIEQVEDGVREQWAVASAELNRVARLDPSAVIIPQEPPHMQVTLVAPEQPLDSLLPVALASRPELISFRALSEAALKRWKEEQFRPLVPSLYFRGGTNQLPDTMMFGAQSGGPNGSFGSFRGRADYEVEMMWELRNLGFGNVAAMKESRAQYDVSRMRAYQQQDFVAREVVQAYAQVRSARARSVKAEAELREAEISAKKNYEGLGTVFRIGEVIIPVIRPQEALASMTALLQAYRDYFGSVADYNRSQFTLYRALGNPAQLLPMLDGSNGDPNCAGGANPNPAPPPPAGVGPVPAANLRGDVPFAVPAPAVGMPASSNDANRPAVNPAAAANPTLPVVPADTTCATVIVRVPANAELYCDGMKMSLAGTERNFVTPPLPPGRAFPYELRVRWTDADGKLVEQAQKVQVQSGQRSLVDFLNAGPKP